MKFFCKFVDVIIALLNSLADLCLFRFAEFALLRFWMHPAFLL